MALAVADTATSLIPLVGDAADLAELGKALATDRHGRPVSAFDLAVLGIAALIPLASAGALRAAGRSTQGAARTLDELATKLGKTREEIDVLLVRIAELTAPDRAALQRVSLALRTGTNPQPDDLRHVRESLTELGFHTDLGPAGGDIFLHPDIAPMHGMRALGEDPEVNGIRETSRRGAGMARPVRHHVFPQEHRKWFEERGFVGKLGSTTSPSSSTKPHIRHSMGAAIGAWVARGQGVEPNRAGRIDSKGTIPGTQAHPGRDPGRSASFDEGARYRHGVRS